MPNVDTKEPDDKKRVQVMWGLVKTAVEDLSPSMSASDKLNLMTFLLEVAWHEGNQLRDRVQKIQGGGDGPARSFFQLEPAKAIDAVDFAKDREADRQWLTKLAGAAEKTTDELKASRDALQGQTTFPEGNLIRKLLEENDLFGVYMARIAFARIEETLETSDDAHAKYWADHWKVKFSTTDPNQSREKLIERFKQEIKEIRKLNPAGSLYIPYTPPAGFPSTAIPEGQLYPLLKWEGDKAFRWAFLATDSKPGDNRLARENQLLRELLQSLGFVRETQASTDWDWKNGPAPAAPDWEIYYLGPNGPKYRVNDSPSETFDARTHLDGVPDPGLLNPSPGKVTIHWPDKALTLAGGGDLPCEPAPNRFRIPSFTFREAAATEYFGFRFGASGTVEPACKFFLGLEKALINDLIQFPTEPPMNFAVAWQAGAGLIGNLKIGDQVVKPSVGATPVAAAITNRRDRLSFKGETDPMGLSLMPENEANSPGGLAYRLGIDAYAGMVIEASPTGPITATVKSNLRCRFSEAYLFQVIGDREAGPCLDITVAIPLLLSADLSSPQAETLPLLDPCQKAIGKAISPFNQVLQFTAKVCFPQGLAIPLLNVPRMRELKFWKFWEDFSVIGVPDSLGVDPKELYLKNPLPLLDTFDGTKIKLALRYRLTVTGEWTEIDVDSYDVASLKLTLKDPLPGIPVGPIEVSVKLLDTLLLNFVDIGIPEDLGPLAVGNWDFPDQKLTLDKALQLPEIHLDRFKIRLSQPNLERSYFGRITKIAGEALSVRAPDWPNVLPDGLKVEIFQDITQMLSTSYLNGLLGDVGPVELRFSTPEFDFSAFNKQPLRIEKDLPLPVALPFEIGIKIPRPGAPNAVDHDLLRLGIAVTLDLKTFRLAANRIYFYLPELQKGVKEQLIDLDVMTLAFPARVGIKRIPDDKDHDGYLDLDARTRELVIDLHQDPNQAGSKEEPPKLKLFFPGGLRPSLAPEELEEAQAKRFAMELEELSPQAWPEIAQSPPPLFFRLNANGITFQAKVAKSKVEVEKGGQASALQKAIELAPQDGKDNLRSRIVIIDNAIREASVFAKMKVPGVENLIADAMVSLRQVTPGKAPMVLAQMELEKSDKAPLADLSVGFLQMQLQKLALALSWLKTNGTAKWDFDAIADGQLSFVPSANMIKDLDDLKNPSAIVFKGLSLKKLNLNSLTLPIDLDKPVGFDILDGMFSCQLGDMAFTWEMVDDPPGPRRPRPRLFAIEQAQFGFKLDGPMEVKLKAGGLLIRFDNNFRAAIEVPSSIGIEAKLGPAVSFNGECGWVEKPKKGNEPEERYFFASGTVELQGFPKVSALLKIGVGRKANGDMAPSVVVYGAMDLDVDLFAGVVVKNLGVGIGVNNKLLAIGSDPTPDQIIANIDNLEPGAIQSWGFVDKRGLFISIVASVTLASNQGDEDVIQGYVARMIATLDSDFEHVVVAGKIWLASSLKFVKNHWNNPVLVGALVLSPKKLQLSAVLESRPNPAVEGNKLLEKIFASSKVRLSFRLSPDLVDFFLEEVSYRDDLFGLQMLYQGSYRIAIFRRALLIRADLQITGGYEKSFSAGPGGFSLAGMLWLRAGYGGLINERGIMAYAYIDAGISFQIDAWIEIRFSITIKAFGKKWSKEWSVKFRETFYKRELRIRGVIAMATDGRIGFDGSIGISIGICGYNLTIEPRLSYNPQVYDEIRSEIAAFEQQLNDYIAVPRREAISLLAMAPLVPVALPAAVGEPKAPEQWLLYSKKLSTGEFRNLLLPKHSERWLTPHHSAISKIEKAGNGLVRITCKGHSLKQDDKIAISGVITPQGLNREWLVAAVDRRPDQFDLQDSGNINADSGLSPAGYWARVDRDSRYLPPFVDDVAAIVVTIGDAFDIEPIEGTPKTLRLKEQHEFVAGTDRVLLLGTGPLKLDGLWKCKPTVETMITELSLEGDKPVLSLGKQTPGDSPKQRVVAVKVVRTPWNEFNWAMFKEQLDAKGPSAWDELESVQTLFFETSDPYPGKDVTEPAHFSAQPPVIVADPRVKSTSRHYWKLEDQFTLPEYAPPYEFRPIEEILSDSDSGIGAKELEELKEFGNWSTKALHAKRHGSHDLDVAAEQHQRRAVMTKPIVDAFSSTQEPGKFDELVTVSENSQEVLGIIFSTPEIKAPADPADPNPAPWVFIKRSNEPRLQKVTVSRPENDINVNDRIELLPIRQKFEVHDNGSGGSGKERSKVIVKLPISLDKLADHLDAVNYFRIFRQIGHQQAVEIADQVRPDLTFIKEAPVIAQGAWSSAGPSWDDEHTEGILTYEDMEGVARRVPIRRTKAGTVEAQSLPEDGARFVLQAERKTRVLVYPFLFTDEFELEDRVFKQQDVRAGSTSIVYSVQAVKYGEDSASAGRTDLRSWGPIKLHVPEKETFPSDLAIVFPVWSLVKPAGENQPKVLGSDTFGKFFLVSIGGEKPEPATIGPRLLEAKDFEVWCEEILLKQSGFFGGEDEAPRAEKGTEGTAPSIESVDAAKLYQSADRKHLVEVVGVTEGASGDSGSPFEMAASAKELFRVGFGYRFFIRPRKHARVKLLAPLPAFVVAREPKNWSATVKMRPVEQVELLNPVEVSDIKQQKAYLSPNFSVDDDFSKGLNLLHVKWESFGPGDGGAEIIFQDMDDSGYIARQSCEILEEDVYLESEKHFGDNSLWSLRQDLQIERIPARVPPRDVTPIPEKLEEYFVTATAEGSAVMNELSNARDALRRILEDANDYNWIEKLVKPVTDWLYAVYGFQRSPLNLKDPKVNDLLEAMRLAVRALIIGLRVPVVLASPDADTVAEIVKNLHENEKELATIIAKTHPQTATTTEASQVTSVDTQLDAELLRGFCGILIRRNAVANDIAGLIAAEKLPVVGSADYLGQGSELLPRQHKWDALLDEAKRHRASGFNLTNTDGVVDLVAVDHVRGVRQALPKLMEAFWSAITDRRERAKVVPRAAGLTLLLDRLEDEKFLPDHTVIKRPHHELTTTTDKTGKIVPRETPIKAFLPEEARRHEKDQPPPPPNPGVRQLGSRAHRLLTAHSDNSVTLWTQNPDSGEEPRLRRMQTLKSEETLKAVDLTHESGMHLALTCSEKDGSHFATVWDLLRARKLAVFDEAEVAVFGSLDVGLGVVTAKGSKVQLRLPNPNGGEPFRAPVEQFTIPKDDTATATGTPPVLSLAVDSDADLIAAGLNDGRVVVWRSVAADPIAAHKFAGGVPIKAVTFAKTPDGLMLLVACGSGIFVWDLSDTEEKSIPTEPRFKLPSGDTGTIASITVEPRTLWVAATVENMPPTDAATVENKPSPYIWTDFFALEDQDPAVEDQDPAVVELGGASSPVTGIRFTLMEDRPALLCTRADGTVWKVTEKGGNDSFEVKSIPELSGNTAAVVSSFMPKVTSDASRSVVSYFNLLERLGFAVDIAMTDKQHQLESQHALIGHVKKVLSKIQDQGGFSLPHDAFILAGQDPIAHYANDPVSFSFIKVAVVPRAFHELCLRDGDDATVSSLKKWYRLRSLDLEGDSNPDVERIYLLHVREMARYIGRPDHNEITQIHVSPRNERWLTVPALGNRSRSVWTVPDRKGHRFRVAVRRVSRYEPLIRWAAGMKTAVPVPKCEVGMPLSVTESSWSSVTVPSQGGVAYVGALLEVISGDGAGQRRTITKWSDNGAQCVIGIDPSDPWQIQPGLDDQVRVVAESESWSPASVLPILDPRRNEGSRALTVYNYPHPSKLMFSYQLPPDGQRSLYNQISAVRSGYKGCELTFRYDLVDHPDNPYKLPKLLGQVKKADAAHIPESIPERRSVTYPGNDKMQVRLFRHERLHTLGDLPFFYKYRMDVRSLYQSRPVESTELTSADMLARDTLRSPFGQREPGRLALFRPTIEVAGVPAPDLTNVKAEVGKVLEIGNSNLHGFVTRAQAAKQGILVTFVKDGTKTHRYIVDYRPRGEVGTAIVDREWPGELFGQTPTSVKHAEYDLTIFLARNIDHLAEWEKLAAPEPLPGAVVDEVEIVAEYFPDFFMDYGIFWLNDTVEEVSSHPEKTLYLPLGWIRLPWSKEYRPKSDAETGIPYVEVQDTQVVLVDPEKGERLLHREIEHFTAGEDSPELRYQIRFRLKLPWGKPFYFEPNRYFLQGLRKGVRTKAFQFKELP